MLVRRRRGVDLTARRRSAAAPFGRRAARAARGPRWRWTRPEGDQLRVVVGALPNMAASLLPEAIALPATHRIRQLRARVVQRHQRAAHDAAAPGRDRPGGGPPGPALGHGGPELSCSSTASLLLLVARPGHPLAAGRQPPLSLRWPTIRWWCRCSRARWCATPPMPSCSRRGNAPPGAVIEATDTSFALAPAAPHRRHLVRAARRSRQRAGAGRIARLDIDTSVTDRPGGASRSAAPASPAMAHGARSRRSRRCCAIAEARPRASRSVVVVQVGRLPRQPSQADQEGHHHHYASRTSRRWSRGRWSSAPAPRTRPSRRRWRCPPHRRPRPVRAPRAGIFRPSRCR